MKTYEFGDKNKPVILLLPGTCCHWKNTFDEVIPLLERSFYVVCVSYDGFDETEDTVFPSMLKETERIEAYIQECFDERICCAYGCSLGGSFVGLLVQRGKIHIDLVTPLDGKIRTDGTVIHCFYATKMGKQYEARYRQYFAAPDIIRHDLQHEELLVCYPQKWVSEIENCCGMSEGTQGEIS